MYLNFGTYTMPRFDYPHVKPTPPPPTDVRFALGWTVDICTSQGGTEEVIYRDCALTTLVRASSLFERLAVEECLKPLAYGQETKIKYVLPPGVAGAAFQRIVQWLYAINEISGHGDIEDPQISTFPGDGLTQYLRLFQAAKLLELKYPFHNQKRLLDIIKATIKKAFDTKNNAFRNITITDREIGLIWDSGNGDRNDSTIKLVLALFVDTWDLRRECSHKYKDNVLQRFNALLEKNREFRSAVIDVKTKKDVRLREEERERRGLPKPTAPQRRGGQQKGQSQRKSGSGNGSAKKTNTKVVNSDDWDSQELTESQVQAVMAGQQYQVLYGNGYGTRYGDNDYGADGQNDGPGS
jgi:hypothetical protein